RGLLDGRWEGTGSISTCAVLGSLACFRSRSRSYFVVCGRPVFFALNSARRRTLGRLGRHDPPSERILKIGSPLSAAGRQDQPDQPRVATKTRKSIQSSHRTGASECRRVPCSLLETHRQYRTLLSKALKRFG